MSDGRVDLDAVFAERRPRGLLAMERACFGTDDPTEVWDALDELVLTITGRRAAWLRHYWVSIGALAGVVLDDGSSVAVKVFAPGHDRTFLEAADRVRRLLVDEGYPAPRPIAPLTPFGPGLAWVDAWLDAPPEAKPDEVIEPLAYHLAELVDRTNRERADPALGGSWQTYDHPVGIWRNPARPDADLAVELPGTEWVTEIAELGRRTVDEGVGPRIVGHVDWRPANVRFDDDRALTAVYDWDSLQLTGRVHVLAGACVGLSPAGMAAFLDAYERHAKVRLQRTERRGVAGRMIWTHAMLSKFELIRRLPEHEQRSVPRLRQDAHDYLAIVD